MVFEKIEKGLRGFPVGGEMISISKTNISFGRIITEDLVKSGFVEIWLDKELNKVGFKAAKDGVRGFKIEKKEGEQGSRTTSKIACQSVSNGLYDAIEEEDGMWVIKVPEIASMKKNE